MDTGIFAYALLIVLGIIAGIVNTMAGGGSNLTVPALMIMGLPPEVANATNRVGVFLQTLVGVLGFKKKDKLDYSNETFLMLVPSLIGGLIGALIASFAPSTILKPLLLGTMISMALIILVFPSVTVPAEGTPIKKLKSTPLAWVGLFIAGIYGGFVQAGVGFILLLALSGFLRYDLHRATALKIFCSLAFTLIALVVFIARGQVDWVLGLILAIGFMIGAKIGVAFTVKLSPKAIKWFLFLMTLVVSIFAIFK